MITLKAWLTSRPDSTAASSEPGSEISSMMGSGDDVSDKLVICMSGPLAEDLVVQGNNGVSSIMADAHESLSSTVAASPFSGAATSLLGGATQPTPNHNTTYRDAIERSGHAQCLWATAH